MAFPEPIVVVDYESQNNSFSITDYLQDGTRRISSRSSAGKILTLELKHSTTGKASANNLTDRRYLSVKETLVVGDNQIPIFANLSFGWGRNSNATTVEKRNVLTLLANMLLQSGFQDKIINGEV